MRILGYLLCLEARMDRDLYSPKKWHSEFDLDELGCERWEM